MNTKSHNTLDLLERYLYQQKDIYGDELYIKSDFAVENLHRLQPKTDSNTLTLFFEEIKDCQKCSLAKTRRNLVFGAGNPDARIMLVGEAPGAEEDRQGEPFVGRAGQLLNRMLKAIQLEREEVYIGNIMKCRPPENRDPSPDEIITCKPYLLRQIEIINPDFLLALGRIAAQALLSTTNSLGKLRGQIHLLGTRRVVVTYHPAALLRFPHYKEKTWEDLQLLKKLYDERCSGN